MARKPTYEELEQRIKEFGKESGEGIRTEEALRENETMFRVAFEQAPVGMCLVNPDGRFLKVNGNICHMLGYSESELFSKTFQDITHPDDLDSSIEWVSNLLAGETTIVDLEKRYLHKEGHVVWGAVRAFLLRKVDGSPRFFITHVQDITERKRAEEELRDSEEKYRNLYEDAPVGYMEYDNKGRITKVNRKELEMLGYTAEEMVGEPAWNFVMEEEKSQGLIKAKLAGDEPPSKNLERTYIRKDGTTFPVLIQDAISKDRSGRIIGIRSTIQDITERKRAEEALRQREEIFRAIFNNAGVGIAIAGKNKTFTMVNDRMALMLGSSKDELIGVSNLAITHPEDIELSRKRLESLFQGEVDSYRIEKRYLRKDGTDLWVDLSVSNIRDKDGNTGASIGMCTDITERKRAEKEREKLEAQLRQAQKMESVGRLAGGVAHDFNNMLGIIIGNVEMAKMGVEPSEPIHNELQEIQKAAQRSAGVVRQLLAFARKQTVSPKVVDLNDTVSGMLKMLRQLIGEEIELAWMPGHDLWRVKIDPSQVDQILANLVVNAKDAVAGVGKLAVETNNVVLDKAYCTEHAGAVPGQYVMLGVSDDGMGMSKDVIGHLFEPFFTTKEVGKGTGLGLATVYGIVKQNNGFISVYSERGQGTTIKIYLPRIEGETVIVSEKAEEKEFPVGTETVLVAEDDAQLLKLTRTILTRQGYKVLAAHSPSEALSLAEQHGGEIHLLLTDVVMPEINGRELMQKLQALRPNLKGLFMSGYTADVVVHHGVLDEGVHFIEKPFSPLVLAEKVREVLDKG